MQSLDPFITQVILPYFSAFKSTNMHSVLFSKEGEVIGITDAAAKSCNLEAQDLLGSSYKNLPHEVIKKVCAFDNVDSYGIEKIIAGFRDLATIHDAVVAEKKLINYIDFLPYKYHPIVELVSHFPIFNNKEEVIATQIISAPNYFFGLDEYTSLMGGELNLKRLKNIEPDLGISEREHEVLFLLRCKFNQKNIAYTLNIQPGDCFYGTVKLFEEYKILSNFYVEFRFLL